MKLLDPFAGYRLASGHPFFHIALFICSFLVDIVGEHGFVSSETIQYAFNLLRWGHFALFMLAIFEAIASRPSPIPETKSADIENKDEAQVARDSQKIANRDGSWKLFSRICNTLSVFIYQGTVFFAQMTLAENIFNCANDGSCTIEPIMGNRMAWLMIETCCFYTYVFAAVAYIAWSMIRGVCEKPDPYSDRAKAITDFICYASINLTWFALNFVLVLMPPLLIFWLQTD